MIGKQYSNDVATEYIFDDLGQLKSLIHSQEKKDWRGKDTLERLDQFHYDYDLLGNKIEVNRIRKGFESDDYGRYHYQYDCLNRLTRVMQGRDILRTYQLGSPMRLIDERGYEQDKFAFDEFGNDTLGKQRTLNPFTFTGYQLDDLSSTLFAQARQYDSTTGRFTSEDKIKGYTQFPQTMNPYSYCWNQPLNLVDLDGFAPDDGGGRITSPRVDPTVYAPTMGASVRRHYRDMRWNSDGKMVSGTYEAVTITYGGISQRFFVDSNGKVDYSAINATFGWENPWIPNGQTYQAFLGSHPVYDTPFHHSSVIIFSTPNCPQFGNHHLFINSFSNVNYTTMGGGAEGGVRDSGQWGTLLGEFNRRTDVDLTTKNDMQILDANAHTIRQMILNTMNFQASPDIRYTLFPVNVHLNSGSFVAGLFASVGITTRPNRLSPGWGMPVPLCHFNNDCEPIREREPLRQS